MPAVPYGCSSFQPPTPLLLLNEMPTASSPCPWSVYVVRVDSSKLFGSPAKPRDQPGQRLRAESCARTGSPGQEVDRGPICPSKHSFHSAVRQPDPCRQHQSSPCDKGCPGGSRATDSIHAASLQPDPSGGRRFGRRRAPPRADPPASESKRSPDSTITAELLSSFCEQRSLRRTK